MNALQLPLLFQAVFCEPIALEASHYFSVASFLLPRMTGKLSPADLSQNVDLSAAAADKPHKFGHQRSGLAMPKHGKDGKIEDARYYNTLEGRADVAVIPWSGIMAKGAGFFQEFCFGMVSHDRLAHAARQAVANLEVKTIVYDIRSPGGTVVGTPELGAVVRESGRAKQTYAFVDDMMASAAVYAGIQAREVYLTPSARIGSIGTIMGILDDSLRMKMEGLNLEVFFAGKHKALGSSGRALTDDDRAYLQSIVDHANQGFVAAVKQARPKVAAEVLTDAKVYTGAQAVQLGLADGLVSDWDEFIGLI